MCLCDVVDDCEVEFCVVVIFVVGVVCFLLEWFY